MVGKNQTSSIYGGDIEHYRRSRSNCKMGPGDRGFSIGVLEFGSKARQAHDRYLGSENGMGSGIDKGEDTVKE